MRVHRMLLGLLIITGVLVLALGQKKPALERQLPAAQNPEENKQMARRVFEDLFTGGRFGQANQVFDPGCKVHFGGRTVGLEQAIAESKGWKSAAPDSRMSADRVTASGDIVTVAWTTTGTHTGTGLGVKPTGKHVNMRGTSRFRFANGKIVEAWNDEYRPELFRQLGVPRSAAFMFFATERLWSAVADFVPNRFYASLSQ